MKSYLRIALLVIYDWEGGGAYMQRGAYMHDTTVHPLFKARPLLGTCFLTT